MKTFIEPERADLTCTVTEESNVFAFVIESPCATVPFTACGRAGLNRMYEEIVGYKPDDDGENTIDELVALVAGALLMNFGA